MINKKETSTLDELTIFSDNHFEDMNLNEDLKKIYEIINDEDLQNEFEEKNKLTNLRNENHKRYYEIKIQKFNDLPHNFNDIVLSVRELYNFIDSKTLLVEEMEDALNHKRMLNNIFRKINRIDKMVETTLKELEQQNDKDQSRFSVSYFNSLDIDQKQKNELLKKYNQLVLYSSVILNDNYESLKREIIRSDYIKEILKLLNLEEINKINIHKKDKLFELNKKIACEIDRYLQKIYYLDDLIIEGSKYKEEFEEFKQFCDKIMNYDKTNYNNARQTYEVLCDDSRFKIIINNFEESFINERENSIREEKFVFEKFGIKNLRRSLDYILANYMDKISLDDKKIIEKICEDVNSENYDLPTLEQKLGVIVSKIWQNTLTDVYSYNLNEDFYFICANNQFIDEKYQTILITKKELQRVDNYLDYQIGFICDYNNNIMYITENEDIMTVDYNDMSNLKTPLQLEQEFINFKVCNRIALNGYITKLVAVYYIEDGNIDKYLKAVELSNMYKLPLIKLKKD